jgi:hypothetical protein
MVNPGVREQLSGAAGPQEKHSVMLRWRDMPKDSLFASATSKRERLDLMDGFYRQLKEPVLHALQGETDVEVRDLPGSAHAIVTGPASKLETLVKPGGLLEGDDKIEVLPNAMFHALG